MQRELPCRRANCPGLNCGAGAAAGAVADAGHRRPVRTTGAQRSRGRADGVRGDVREKKARLEADIAAAWREAAEEELPVDTADPADGAAAAPPADAAGGGGAD